VETLKVVALLIVVLGATVVLVLSITCLATVDILPSTFCVSFLDTLADLAGSARRLVGLK
jgi:hypothetical protein